MRKIKKGDNVIIIAGKDKGKSGKVLEVRPKESRIIVEGVNIVKKATRPKPPAKEGGIVSIPAPIHISNAMLLCVHCKMKTRVNFSLNKEGKKVRVCKKCKEIIDV